MWLAASALARHGPSANSSPGFTVRSVSAGRWSAPRVFRCSSIRATVLALPTSDSGLFFSRAQGHDRRRVAMVAVRMGDQEMVDRRGSDPRRFKALPSGHRVIDQHARRNEQRRITPRVSPPVLPHVGAIVAGVRLRPLDVRRAGAEKHDIGSRRFGFRGQRARRRAEQQRKVIPDKFETGWVDAWRCESEKNCVVVGENRYRSVARSHRFSVRDHFTSRISATISSSVSSSFSEACGSKAETSVSSSFSEACGSKAQEPSHVS